MKNKKLYCKNCKYYSVCLDGCIVGTYHGSDYFTEIYINHKGKKDYKWKNKDEFDKLKEETNSSTYCDGTIGCCNFNKKYNCKYYKRKWWKFWIK